MMLNLVMLPGVLAEPASLPDEHDSRFLGSMVVLAGSGLTRDKFHSFSRALLDMDDSEN